MPQQHLAAAAGCLTEADQGIELAVFDPLLGVRGVGVVDEAPQLRYIAGPMHHPGDGRQAIPAGPAGFLVVGLQAFGQVDVGDEAHIGFVDAHAKGDRGHHDHAAIAPKTVEGVAALLGAEAGVIGHRIEASGAQVGGKAIHPAAGAGIDDAGLAAPIRQKGQQLAAGLVLVAQQIADVGPIETGQKHPALLQPQALADLLAGAGVGGGGEGEAGDRCEALGQHRQLQVFRPEIMAPLRNAMGLVDGEQGQGQRLQPIEKARAQQSLGGDIEQIQLALLKDPPHGGRLRGLQRGVEGGGPHARLAQALHLVLHQGDQGRHHHPHAAAAQGRNLIAKRFATAGGHQHQGRAARHYVLDNLGLGAAEGAVAEHLLQHLGGIGAGGGAGGAIGGRGGGHGVAVQSAISAVPPPWRLGGRQPP